MQVWRLYIVLVEWLIRVVMLVLRHHQGCQSHWYHQWEWDSHIVWCHLVKIPLYWQLIFHLARTKVLLLSTWIMPRTVWFEDGNKLLTQFYYKACWVILHVTRWGIFAHNRILHIMFKISKDWPVYYVWLFPGIQTLYYFPQIYLFTLFCWITQFIAMKAIVSRNSLLLETLLVTVSVKLELIGLYYAHNILIHAKLVKFGFL